MNWIKATEDNLPKDRPVLGYFDFCGRELIESIEYHSGHGEWITTMGRTYIDLPEYYMELPKGPHGN